jgi:hypothetical protein
MLLPAVDLSFKLPSDVGPSIFCSNEKGKGLFLGTSTLSLLFEVEDLKWSGSWNLGYFLAFIEEV